MARNRMRRSYSLAPKTVLMLDKLSDKEQRSRSMIIDRAIEMYSKYSNNGDGRTESESDRDDC